MSGPILENRVTLQQIILDDGPDTKRHYPLCCELCALAFIRIIARAMDILKALGLAQTQHAKPVIALTGAGGKSTLLFRLGAELAMAGYQTLLTSTTKLWARQIDRAPFSLVAADPRLLEKELPISLRGYKQVLVLAGRASEAKLRGLAPDVVCRLLALADVDAAVVEADGSRERPLKAPAGHEPVVPACATHVLVVAGMTILGQPLDADHVHRPERVAQLTGLRAGDAVTAEAMARLLAHPQGGLKGLPAGASAWLYLNLLLDAETPQAEAQRRLDSARQIARLALAARGETGFLPGLERESGAIDAHGEQDHPAPKRNPVSRPGFQAVLIGSAAAQSPVDEVHGRVAGIVLAAGRSSRFASDQPKQLLPWGDGNTLLGHVIDTALAAQTLERVLVVSGYEAARVEAATPALRAPRLLKPGRKQDASVAGRPVQIVRNEAWQDGQSSSVRAALQALPGDVSAAVFLLADQPDVQPQAIDALVQAHRRSLAPIVAPRYEDGQRGNPVLFDRAAFPELLNLTGDVGGRPLIGRYGSAVRYVELPGSQPQGIDTLEDYQRRRDRS